MTGRWDFIRSLADNMTVLDAALNVDRSTPDFYFRIPRDLYEPVGFTDDVLDFDAIEKSRELTCHWLRRWYCSDSYVGVRCYYLSDELIAVSNQSGRKDDETVWWITKESIPRVKAFFERFVNFEERENQITILDPKLTIAVSDSPGESILDYSGTYKGRSCTIDPEKKRLTAIARRGLDWDTLRAKKFMVEVTYDDDGSKEMIDINDFEVPLNIRPPAASPTPSRAGRRS